MEQTLAYALAALTFGIPALAWGAAAAAVPLIIHLVFRQRPRREVLPTLRFLLQAHMASTRAQRIKHLILLACRMMAILLVVGLLMKTGCAPPDATHPGTAAPVDGPVSAVIVIDDSASMQYRFQGRTRLEDAQTWARNLLADRDRFPPGSELAVISGATDPTQPPGWSHNPRALIRLVSGIQPGWHDRPAAALLRHAYAILANAGHPRREVYLFTDLADASWQEPPPEPPDQLAGVFVLDVGTEENRNFALSIPDVPRNTLSPTQPSTARIRVQTGDLPVTATLTMSIDGRPRDRKSLRSTPDGARSTGARSASEGTAPTTDARSANEGGSSVITFNFSIPPLPEGPHELVFQLEPEDALGFDNRRFACISVGKTAGVVVAGAPGGASVAALVSAMIAPPALPAEQHRFLLKRTTGQALADAMLDRPLAVILADPPDMTSASWGQLEQYVSDGGTLVLIPGPNSRPPDTAGAALLPAEILGIAQITDPITLAAADLSVSYLKPFADAGIDSINDRLVYRRLTFGPTKDEARIVAPFSDHSPAILERRVKAGQVIQFAFSPDREWSQFGAQAGPMIVLLHSLLESLAPRPDNIDGFVAGRLATRRWPDGAGEYHIQPPDGPPSPLPLTQRATILPTASPGHYHVSAAPGQSQPAFVYSVNVSETESARERASDDLIRSQFRPGLITIAHQPDGLPSRQAGTGGAVSWVVPLALALLGLIWFESYFANRFYAKSAPSSTTAPQGAQPAMSGGQNPSPNTLNQPFSRKSDL